jgi:hypothetical protein
MEGENKIPFRLFTEGSKSRVVRECMEYMIKVSNGDLNGLFDRKFFHTGKEMGVMMRNFWLYLINIMKGFLHLSVLDMTISDA